MTCTLYVLVDPAQPRRFRYVGITTMPPTRRRKHITRPATGTNRPLWDWVQGLLRNDREPLMHVLGRFPSPAEAHEREWRTILRWQRRGACDLNQQRFGSERYALRCAARLAEGATKVQPNGSATRNGPQKEPLTSPAVA